MPYRADDDLTMASDLGVTVAPDSSSHAARGAQAVPLHFAPGAIVAGRYRLVALLGRGGMGEVYRADDLTLDHPVALKFLPDGATTGAQLAQFHNELRTARQVSHKNVCRLYDLSEADGRRFLTMEYVDGEDLASLLRRIGRIPQDKAVDIARQLCAGISAAHERGVLHRDLKPANVMLDGEGNVRITDFGLAVAAGTTDAVLAGTPQYMAPEQLAGGAAAVKTDLYALGLILFEIFTGRRAYDAKTLPDLVQLHQSGVLPAPSSVVRDLDPAIERLVLRCLDRDPTRRPASALAVAAALPGANPLAEALAAGETPSPELLAAAGESEALQPGRALVMVAWIAAGLIAFAGVSGRTSIVGRTPLDKAPAVLLDRAEQIVHAIGYDDQVGDRAYNFIGGGDYLRWLAGAVKTPHRFDALAKGDPSGVLFWSRTSPHEMQPLLSYAVWLNDPAPADTNMRSIVVDMQGRLRELRVVPPQVDTSGAQAAAPDWRPLFDAAALPIDRFTPVAPQWSPRDFADTRAAWTGVLPGDDSIAIRVEAAAYRGRPVAFQIVGPWTRPLRMTPLQVSTVDRFVQALFVVVFTALVLGAAFFAHQKIRRKRADQSGAVRLALAVFGLSFLGWLFAGHHLASPSLEFQGLVRAAGGMTLTAMFLWLIYLALEPYVRRFWPDGLLGWTRLLSGRFRDARVGRDVLAGIAFGVAIVFSELGKALIVPMLGYEAPFPTYARGVETLGSNGLLASVWIESSLTALKIGLVVVLWFVVLRLLLKRPAAFIIVGWVTLALVESQNIGGDGFAVVLLFPLAAAALLTFVTLRFGLLTLVVTIFVQYVASTIPLTLDLSSWHATPSNWTIAVLMAFACAAFYAARGAQPLFGDLLPGD